MAGLKELVEKLEVLISVMKSCKDLGDLFVKYNIAYNIIKKIAEEDQNLSDDLKNKLDTVKSSSDLREVLTKLEEVTKILNSLKVKPSGPQKYIDPLEIIYSLSYEDARKKYASFKFNIEDVETKIIESPNYNKKLHGALKYGLYKGYLHARLTANLRILYKYNFKSQVLVFVDIKTKNELEKS